MKQLVLMAAIMACLVLAEEAGQDQQGQRLKRQYQRRPSVPRTANRPPWEVISPKTFSHRQLVVAPAAPTAVKYDASNLGFEIEYPQHHSSFQYQHRPPAVFFAPVKHHEPEYKPKPEVYQPKPEVYRPKPEVYQPKPVDAYTPPYVPVSGYVPAVPYAPNAYAHEYYCPRVAGLDTTCRPVKDCAVWYDQVVVTPKTACKLHDGSAGACCPALPYNGKSDVITLKRKPVKIDHPIDIYQINSAAKEGQYIIRLMGETEKLLVKKGITVRRNSAAFTHLLFFQTKPATRRTAQGALLGVETTNVISKRFLLTAEQAGFGLSQYNLRDTIISDSCPAEPACVGALASSVYRTLDGSCNNLRRGGWGMSKTQFQRGLAAQYADGVWRPRISVVGDELPSARLVSISVVPDIDNPHETGTLWVMQYGQFVDHDLTSTPVFRMSADGTGIVCCADDGKALSSQLLVHPECLPIDIPDDDPFFSPYGQRCMSFVRSMPAPRLDCSFGHGEQMNQLTHFLDHSNVYGSDDEEAHELRAFKGGLLKVTPRSKHGELDLLPPDDDPEEECVEPVVLDGVDPSAESKCFKAGDSRANEQPSLAVTHTIFMREHNRLAKELSYLNPYWDDERLYQEARRILIGQMQHITYNEWLPIVVGRQKMAEMGLLPLSDGFSSDYSELVNPTILNEFATAAFRFGHTLVQGRNHLMNTQRKVEHEVLLRHHFFRSQIVYTPGNLDKFLIGLATQPMQDFDNYVSEELTNHLFEESDKPFGMDLVALNIQRGRDHGLPGYNAYRALCGLPRARHFDDLLDVIPKPILERFKLLYRSVEDIDLFIAGISERSAKGALLGPTFQCIMADQFLRLKRGDRFFYDLGGQPHSFTIEQLDEIRKASFARLICDNSRVYSAQPLAFQKESEVNPVVDCHSYAIPRINLQFWKDDYGKPYEKPYAKPYEKPHETHPYEEPERPHEPHERPHEPFQKPEGWDHEWRYEPAHARSHKASRRH